MKILVIGGMHGNEPLGIGLVELFKESPQKNVEAVIANEKAVKINSRFVKSDLNRSFPGNSRSYDWETKRSAELLGLCREFDLVLDFHNTHCPNNDCSFLGESAKDNLYTISGWLGLRRVIVADYDCINKYAPNCLSVEISLGGKMMSAQMWYDKISKLADLNTEPVVKKLEVYKFVYRLTLEDRNKYNLASQKLRAFKPISASLTSSLNLEWPAYPIFIGDKYTPYNYGGILSKV